MARWLDRMSDPDWRYRMGRRFEALTDEVFHVVRWATLVGFVGFLEVAYPHPVFTVLRWVLSFFLLGYIASRFLLRPEIRFVPADAGPWARAAQFLLNFILCVFAFGLVLWGIELMVDAVTDYRALR